MAPTLSVALAKHWVEDGVVSSVEQGKRQEAAIMFDIAKRSLADVDFRGAPDALHGWITLPPKWRGESFVAAASANLGIAVAPGRAFAVATGTAPPGVRIAYSAPDLKTWELAIRELGKLVRQPPAK